jgi:hypothetical protein
MKQALWNVVTNLKIMVLCIVVSQLIAIVKILHEAQPAFRSVWVVAIVINFPEPLARGALPKPWCTTVSVEILPDRPAWPGARLMLFAVSPLPSGSALENRPHLLKAGDRKVWR